MVTITQTSASTTTQQQQEPIAVTVTNNGTGTSNNNTTTIPVQQDNSCLTITSSTIQQVHRLATSKNPTNPELIYLRIYVDSGGCSGFQYKFDLESFPNPNHNDDDTTSTVTTHHDDLESDFDEEEDIVIHASYQDGSYPVSIVTDPSSLELIGGSTLDYVQEMIKSSFVIVDNPQSENACGCGSSFAVKNFKSNPALD